MRVIVAGSRSIKDPKLVEEAIREAPFRITELVSGGADGVDTLAKEYANQHNLDYQEFTPDWDEYGKSAGPQRNHAMAVYASALIGLWDGESKGTQDVIQKALSEGLDVYVKQSRSNGNQYPETSIKDW